MVINRHNELMSGSSHLSPMPVVMFKLVIKASVRGQPLHEIVFTA